MKNGTSLPDNGGQDSPEWIEKTLTVETSGTTTYFNANVGGAVDKLFNVKLLLPVADPTGRLEYIYYGLFSMDYGGFATHGTLLTKGVTTEGYAAGYLRFKITRSLADAQKNGAKLFIKEVI